jgi:hypothetical protein
MRRFEFAKVQQGENAGEFVSYVYDLDSPSVMVDKEPPYNPYITGYGGAIPTRYRVRASDHRWHRVYCMCYSNSGTCYIRQNNQLVFVDIR